MAWMQQQSHPMVEISLVAGRTVAVKIQTQTQTADGTEMLEQGNTQGLVESWGEPVLEWSVVMVEEEEQCMVVFQHQVACTFLSLEPLGCTQSLWEH